MAVMDEDCGKFLALKDALKKDGLTLYQRGEFVPHKKRSLAWQVHEEQPDLDEIQITN